MIDTLLARTGNAAATLWDLDPEVLHLNHGSYGAVPVEALRHQAEVKSEMERSPVLFFTGLVPRIEQARLRVAAFLGSDPDGTALVPNASAGITVVLRSLPLAPGATIVLTDHTYGAVRMAAERAVAAVGGSIVTVPIGLDAGAEEVLSAITAVLTREVAAVITDAITSPTARRMPVAAITAACRERGVVSIVDGAHAPAALDDPVEDCDYWTGNLHKFGCAPRGTAALVTRPDLGQRLFPVIDSWGTPEPYPARFDRQGTVDATSWLAAPTALEHLGSEVGWNRLRDHAAATVDAGARQIAEACRRLTGEGAVVLPAMAADTMRLVELPRRLAADHAELGIRSRRLATEHQCEVALTGFGDRIFLRLSAHGYTGADDLDRFCAAPLRALVGG